MKIAAYNPSFSVSNRAQVSSPAVADNAFSPVQGESFQSSNKHMGDYDQVGKMLGGLIFGGIGAGAGGVGGTWAGYAIGNSSGHPVVGMALGGIVGLVVGGAAGAHYGSR